MKYLALLLMVLSVASCGNDTPNTDAAVKITESASPATTNSRSDVKSDSETNSQENTQKLLSTAMPDFADYHGVCPEAWGIVKGAKQTHVDKFVKNYFYVPENSGQMYSDINTSSQANGATLIKAGTYKMHDTIVDQEMVALFVAGKMTECGFRLRCSSSPGNWVSSCD